MINPILKELIQRNRFHVKPVLEVVPLLPESDEELDAWVEEAVRTLDQGAYNYVVCAALIAGRPVDSRHLVRGLVLSPEGQLMAAMVWRMTGEVGENLVKAVQEMTMTRERNAEALLIAALWCRKHREGRMPAALSSKARALARDLAGSKVAGSMLWAVAELTADESLKSLMRGKVPMISVGKESAVNAVVAELHEKWCEMAVQDLIPLTPPQVIACGTHVRRAVEKVGRNDPCPCGSGQKYKRCCHEKDQERLRFSSDVPGKTVAEVQAEQERYLKDNASLMKLSCHEVARLDVLKMKPELRECLIAELTTHHLVDEAVTAFERIGCHGGSQQQLWDVVMSSVCFKRRKDLAERMMELRYGHGPLPWGVRPAALLLLRQDDPAAFLEMLEHLARQALEDSEEVEVSWLCEMAYAVMISPMTALGVMLGERLIPIISKREGVGLLDQILKARDRAGLPPQEPFADLLEKRFSEEVSDEGKDAQELRVARQKLEAKAAENRQQTEQLRQREREVRLLEKRLAEKSKPAEAEADAAELRELKEMLRLEKSANRQSGEERAQLRRELGQAYADLKAERKEKAKTPAAPQGNLPSEDDLLLPGEVESTQPPRLIEFPRRFQDTLLHLPRQVGRAALMLCGRLAAGDPSAYLGVVRLKAAPDVLRVRVGMDHRMLFRLLPDTVEIVDLINRRDLEKRIKSL